MPENNNENNVVEMPVQGCAANEEQTSKKDMPVIFAAIGVIALAIVGLVGLVKKGVHFVKSKLPKKAAVPEQAPTAEAQGQATAESK